MGFFSDIVKNVAGPVLGLAGDVMGNRSREKTAAASWAQTKEAANLEYQRQKEFAQMGIRWRTADAKAAGLHPLAAIGANTSTYSPSAVIAPTSGGDDYSGFQRGLHDMGQASLRRELAAQTPVEKEASALALKNAALRNDLLEAQIASQWATIDSMLRSPALPSAVGPSAVAIGDTAVVDGGRVKLKPAEVISSKSGFNQIEAGKHPSMRDYKTPGGGNIRLPSPQLAETLENMGTGVPQSFMIYNWGREKLYGPGIDKPLPKGYHWKWSVWDQGYRAVRD